MKPTQEKILQWAREVWGDDSGKPWSDSALLHITELATLAYEAGRKDEQEKVAQWMVQRSYATGHGDTTEDLLAELEWQVREAAIRARREQ